MSLFWNEFLEKYVNYVDKRFLTILTNVSYFSRAYLCDLTENTYEFNVISAPEEMKLDRIDIEILKLLAYNSRIPIVDIALKLDVTSKTIISAMVQLILVTLYPVPLHYK